MSDTCCPGCTSTFTRGSGHTPSGTRVEYCGRWCAESDIQKLLARLESAREDD